MREAVFIADSTRIQPHNTSVKCHIVTHVSIAVIDNAGTQVKPNATDTALELQISTAVLNALTQLRTGVRGT